LELVNGEWNRTHSLLGDGLFSVPASLGNLTAIQRGFFLRWRELFMACRFNLQGHRGARGLKPENTLPSFEAAFDLGVTSIETDVHLTRDGVPILVHDAMVGERLFRLRDHSIAPAIVGPPLVSSLTLVQLRCYSGDRNPDPARFPDQDPAVTPAAARFAAERGIDAYGPPTLAELFDFALAYAGQVGVRSGKTAPQRERVQHMRFDLELKRVPFHDQVINDGFDGETPGLLERKVIEAARSAGFLDRTIVRSFDHRSVRAMKTLEAALTTAVLVSGTAPVDVPQLVRTAHADIYCPQYQFLDRPQVQQAHGAGIPVVAWTVNDPEAWARLLDWGVDGMTTDFPDRLAEFLRVRGVQF
jgi:glycerophosphoryl diester phosphodiesterase